MHSLAKPTLTWFERLPAVSCFFKKRHGRKKEHSRVPFVFICHLHLHLHHPALGKVPFWLVAVFPYVASYTTSLFRNITPSRPHFAREKDSHNTENFTPYSFWMVCGCFKVPHWNFKHRRYCETGPTVYVSYPRRLESLTIHTWNFKGSTFSTVFLRPWVVPQPTGPPVCG